MKNHGPSEHTYRSGLCLDRSAFFGLVLLPLSQVEPGQTARNILQPSDAIPNEATFPSPHPFSPVERLTQSKISLAFPNVGQ